MLVFNYKMFINMNIFNKKNNLREERRTDMRFNVDIIKLNEELAINGYNKASFCRASGLSYQTLMNIFNKSNTVSPKVAKTISDTLNIDIKDIFSLQST